MKTSIETPADIADLGWVGNWGADRARFALVRDYIEREPDLRKRQEADRLASLYGCGEYVEIDPAYDPRES